MDEGINILGCLLALGLALVHIFAGRGRWLEAIPNKVWISFAGGISITYIFLDVFPELNRAQSELEETSFQLAGYLEHHVYLLSLAGLLLFYGLEKLALKSPLRRYRHHPEPSDDPSDYGIFWVHIFSFSIYNAVLGYLFRESATHGVAECLLLFVALALHFMVNDVGLRQHHPHVYDRFGRWILAGAIVTGWGIGQAADFNGAAIAAIWALVAGGIILNILKEELPERQSSHFGWFVAGAASYAVILLSI